MKPAEAVSSSGLGTIRPDRQILNQPQQFLQLPKEKKIIPRRSIASNCPYTLTLCYGGGWGTALAVAATCVPTALAVAATCVYGDEALGTRAALTYVLDGERRRQQG
jgi:hypothetical protein